MTPTYAYYDFPATLALEDYPTVIIDTREQTPLPITRLNATRDTLYSGDYSIAGAQGQFAIERKSISDLVGSVTAGRERFEHELQRLCGVAFRRLLIIGAVEDLTEHRYRSIVDPKTVLGSVASFETRYNIPVVYAANPELGALQVEKWAAWTAYNLLKSGREISKASKRIQKADSKAAKTPLY